MFSIVGVYISWRIRVEFIFLIVDTWGVWETWDEPVYMDLICWTRDSVHLFSSLS